MALRDCEQCGKPYEAVRASSKYCGAKCRKLAFQDKNAKNAKGVPTECAKPVTGYLSSTDKVATKVATELPEKLPANFGQPDCECRHCRAVKARQKALPKAKDVLSPLAGLIMSPAEVHASSLGTPSGFLLTWLEMFGDELNRVALPGDPDYVGAG